jgi:hypothetical protein
MALALEPIYQRQDIYEPLEKVSRDIRVISLHAGLYSEALECDLIHTSLASPLESEKLSYTWGDPELVSQILVNGYELHIHGNLDAALRHLRLKDSPRILWTDAVCINQASTSERNSQVAMMAQVYESAGAVLVWLGPASEDSHLAIDLLIEMRLNKFADNYMLESVRNHDNFPRWKALFALCRREYWNRIWTAQEIICDKEAVLICGNHSIAFAGLAEVSWVVQRLHYGEAVIVPGILDAGLNRLQIPSNYRALQTSHRTEEEPDLLTLMTTFRAHRCSDPRDKVYGMASMARDVRRRSFPVDYNLSIGQVYLQAAKWTIESTKKLNVLCCRFGQDPAFNLPSWVPDWTSKRYQNQLSPTSGYLATGYTLTDAEFSRGSRILAVAGCCLGTIDILGEAYTEYSAQVHLSKQMAKTIQRWLQLALYGNSPNTDEHPPDVGDACINAFWRTLICNRAEGGYQIEDSWYRSMFDVARGAVAVPQDNLANSADSDEDNLQRYVAPLVASLDNRMPGRRFFRSGDDVGKMGIGPAHIKLEDQICLLMGCDIPIILRSEGDHFLLVGEAYVHGFMQGEADALIQERKVPLQGFSIH